MLADTIFGWDTEKVNDRLQRYTGARRVESPEELKRMLDGLWTLIELADRNDYAWGEAFHRDLLAATQLFEAGRFVDAAWNITGAAKAINCYGVAILVADQIMTGA